MIKKIINFRILSLTLCLFVLCTSITVAGSLADFQEILTAQGIDVPLDGTLIDGIVIPTQEEIQIAIDGIVLPTPEEIQIAIDGIVLPTPEEIQIAIENKQKELALPQNLSILEGIVLPTPEEINKTIQEKQIAFESMLLPINDLFRQINDLLIPEKTNETQLTEPIKEEPVESEQLFVFSPLQSFLERLGI